MPMPRWVARLNRRFSNRLVLLWAGWVPGMAVLQHVGRTSGRQYRTPLNVFPVDGGYLFLAGYGPQTDWLLNIKARGSAHVQHYGKTVQVDSPHLATRREAAPLIPRRWRPMYALFPFPYNQAVLVTATHPSR
ncbi:hypothetical protein C1Y40_02154 [Mycobacterium talmoniae]|uniref:Peptidase n=2 Tax=Mycobacterium talmoniae TaxID=1858794 RepID=A0A1S1NHG4_9MYCO|nr:peptidase [Mycobacterium talmoniae]PQM47644.1 hypothetical protein C1Y40_02154 [Mycobacterium talmoniae]TDH56490.1 nitroreductase family deazaflavin-dependent oxidoreductase [Mycobacterium eburneum]